MNSCKLHLISKAMEFDKGSVIHHMRKKILLWNNQHFTASCWKDLAPKKRGK